MLNGEISVPGYSLSCEINPLFCGRAIPYLKSHNNLSTTKKGTTEIVPFA